MSLRLVSRGNYDKLNTTVFLYLKGVRMAKTGRHQGDKANPNGGQLGEGEEAQKQRHSQIRLS